MPFSSDSNYRRSLDADNGNQKQSEGVLCQFSFHQEKHNDQNEDVSLDSRTATRANSKPRPAPASGSIKKNCAHDTLCHTLHKKLRPLQTSSEILHPLPESSTPTTPTPHAAPSSTTAAPTASSQARENRH